MNKIKQFLAVVLISFLSVFFGLNGFLVNSASNLPIPQGGTGTSTDFGYFSTKPTAGQLLMGSSTGKFVLVNTSTFGWLTNESDPIFLANSSSLAYLKLTDSNTSSWNTAFSWGNHALVGYLTTSTGLTTANFATNTISQWYNDSGYITTTPAETDPIWNIASSSYFKLSENNTSTGNNVFTATNTFTSIVANKVGIGTTTPTNLLSIEKNTANSEFVGMEVLESGKNVGLKTGVWKNSTGAYDLAGLWASPSTPSNLNYIFGTTGATSDTYLNSPSGKGIYFQNSGVNMMTMLSTGFFAIGTTTAPAKLTIQTSGTSDALNIFETGGSEILTVRENGNVGIGRTAPDFPLEVDGSISIWDSDNVSKGIRLVRNSQFLGGMNTNNSQVSFYASPGNGLIFTASGTVDVMKIFPSGNINIGNIASNPTAKLDIYSTIGSISNETDYAIKIRDVAGTVGFLMGVNVTSGIAIFQSMDPGSTWSTKPFVFQPNGGKFSIGMVTPTYAFDVGAPNRASQITGDLSVDTANNVVYVGKLDSSSGNSTFIMRDRLNNEKLKFFNGGSGSIFMGNMGAGFGVRIQGTAVGSYALTQTTTARLEVISNGAGFPAANFLEGNVGIGTTTPASILDVYSASSTSGVLTNLYNNVQSIFKVYTNGIIEFGNKLLGHYIKIDESGRITFNGNARFKKFFQIPAGALQAPGANPATEVSLGLNGVWEFASNLDEQISFNIAIPSDIDRTVTTTTIRVGLSSPTASGDISWKFEYLYLDVGTPVNTTTYSGTSYATSSPNVANGYLFTSITINAPTTTNRVLVGKLTRMGSLTGDTGGVADVQGMLWEYTADKLGTQL